MDIFVMIGTILTIVSICILVLYIGTNWGKLKKGTVILLVLLNAIIPTLTYIYTVPRMDNEIQDVRTAIANKQKIIMIDTSYLWSSQINRLHKELVEAGYTQDSWLVFTIKEE